LTAGNINDCTMFIEVHRGADRDPDAPSRTRGKPWTRPRRVLADKGYSTRAIREHPRRRGIAATIPERADQHANRQRRGTSRWPPTHLRPHRLPAPQRGRTLLPAPQATPRHRHRRDKTAQSYQGMLDLATLLMSR
jgi:hypothetical protein